MHKTCVIARGGEAPGTPVFPFSFPARSEGMERREGARGPAKPPLAGLAKPAARLARRARLLAKRRCAPLALHPQSSGRSLRRLDCGGAHCRRAAPCSSSSVTRDDARCEQGAMNISALERAGISYFRNRAGLCRRRHRERVATRPRRGRLPRRRGRRACLFPSPEWRACRWYRGSECRTSRAP